MRIIYRPQTDPFFNLAAEEYLLKTATHDCFMLWQNEPCIVVGKHQNTLAEINIRFVADHGIPVIRRITGGGAVFHDLGNLNFSFIAKGERDKLVNFRKFIDPVVRVLNKLGVPAQFSGKSDIRVNGLKISGNAEHVYKNKVLHHGTLLFSSEMHRLNRALQVREGVYTDKGVKSVRSQVVNITDFLDHQVNMEGFRELVYQNIFDSDEEIDFYDLTEEEVSFIHMLAEEKYKTWDWNFGYSPDYRFINSIRSLGAEWSVDLLVQKGIINEITIYKNNTVFAENQFFEKLLKGKKHNFAELNDWLTAIPRQEKLPVLNPEMVNNLLF